MKRLFSYLLLLTSYLLLFSCSAEGEYSTWPCRFTYDNSLHLDPTLASAMNVDSRGVFCKIWDSSMGGLVLHFQSNQGSDATHQTVTEMERMSNYILGLNNGIIIGFQTMNTQPNGGFVAYDAQCPNCVRRENNYLNPVTDHRQNGAAAIRLTAKIQPAGGIYIGMLTGKNPRSRRDRRRCRTGRLICQRHGSRRNFRCLCLRQECQVILTDISAVIPRQNREESILRLPGNQDYRSVFKQPDRICLLCRTGTKDQAVRRTDSGIESEHIRRRYRRRAWRLKNRHIYIFR